MKSKWTTYLLIVAVIAVWGVVAWKIFTPSQPVAESPVTAKKPSVVADLKEEKLCLDYPDPFLKGVSQSTPERTTPRSFSIKKTVKPRKKVDIVHLATVVVGKQELHILTIDKEQYELCEGENAGDFCLKDSDRDSLYLENGGVVYGVKRCE